MQCIFVSSLPRAFLFTIVCTWVDSCLLPNITIWMIFSVSVRVFHENICVFSSISIEKHNRFTLRNPISTKFVYWLQCIRFTDLAESINERTNSQNIATFSHERFDIVDMIRQICGIYVPLHLNFLLRANNTSIQLSHFYRVKFCGEEHMCICAYMF